MSFKRNCGGFALLEALVAMVIIAIGLLGLAGLNARSNQVELEALQRVQATIIVNDLAERMLANRMAAACYARGADILTGATIASCGTGECTDMGCESEHVLQSTDDLTAWKNLLTGAAADDVSPLLAPRGCVVQTSADEYLVTISWQGATASAAPVDDCGENEYTNAAGVESENWRRSVSIPVRIARLCDSGIGNCNG